jgi:hypothetical protein
MVILLFVGLAAYAWWYRWDTAEKNYKKWQRAEGRVHQLEEELRKLRQQP